MSFEAKTPPPYIIPMDGSGDNVKVYKVHTPFSPIGTTVQDYRQTTQVSTAQSTESDRNRFISQEMQLGRSPGMIYCTHCQEQVLTNVTYKVGAFAWLMCILFILCGLVVGCCLLPFFLKFFKDVYHSCPKCHRVVHVDKKKCC